MGMRVFGVALLCCALAGTCFAGGKKSSKKKTEKAAAKTEAAANDESSAVAEKPLPAPERIGIGAWKLERDDKTKAITGKVEVVNTSKETLYRVLVRITLFDDQGKEVAKTKLLKFQNKLKPGEKASKKVMIKSTPDQFAHLGLVTSYYLEAPSKSDDVPDAVSLKDVGKELAEEIDDTADIGTAEFFVSTDLKAPERYKEQEGDTGSTSSSSGAETSGKTDSAASGKKTDTPAASDHSTQKSTSHSNKKSSK